jgi:hypothetical protein
VRELKARMIPDSLLPPADPFGLAPVDQMPVALEDEERLLIEEVLGVPLATTVVPGSKAATQLAIRLRRLCGVLAKTPQFLLSHLGPRVPVEPDPIEDVAFERSETWYVADTFRNADLVTELFPMPAGCPLPAFAPEPTGGLESAGPPNGCPAVSWELPALCGGRAECRTPLPLVDRLVTGCVQDGCGDGKEVEALVSGAVATLLLPTDPAALAGDKRSVFDRRNTGRTLVLPLEGGTVKAASGGVLTLRNGRASELGAGERIAFGQVLLVRAGAQLSLEAAEAQFSTAAGGMEAPVAVGQAGQSEGAVAAWIVVAGGASAKERALRPVEGAVEQPVSLDPSSARDLPIWRMNGEGGLP